MSRINVLVTTKSPDIKAEVIAAAVEERSDMILLEHRVLTVAEADALCSASSLSQCAVILVGLPNDTEVLSESWLAKHAGLVVLHVDLIDTTIQIKLRDPHLESLLSSLCHLVKHTGSEPQERVSRVQLQFMPPMSTPPSPSGPLSGVLHQQPLMQAAINWIHTLLRDAVERVPDYNGDFYGLSVSRTTLLQTLDALGESEPHHSLVENADAALTEALAAADARAEPLALVARQLELSPLEFRLMVLALAPELDPRYQRCVGFLLDEMGRRVGTFSLYTALLGTPSRVRSDLAETTALSRWRIFDCNSGKLPPADEPLRVDPFLAGWLLGERLALEQDPRVRRALRLTQWPGHILLDGITQRARATELLSKLHSSDGIRWNVFATDDPTGWRALIELAARELQSFPIRVETPRLAGLDIAEIEETGIRLARIAQLTGQPLVIDVIASEASYQGDDWTRLLFETIGSTGCPANVICGNDTRIVRLLGSTSYNLIEGQALQASERVSAIIAAAKGAESTLGEDIATTLASQYPLQVDGFEYAMRLAYSRRLPDETNTHRCERFISACKDIAAEGVSHLSERIEPIFKLDDVILPADRKQQLEEIIDSIRFTAQVLDKWKFGEQLPYGRGVTALFHGPSGTGKTMAALGVARKLGIYMLRIDLSRVVSKYIGDTEKNIDRVFDDAQKSGAAILIDEADALLGKRSEVKDAHDRYANIEVAYLLQRIETYEGLAVLTTNLRQNLDPAFLRRLRFIVDFPRPDADAREQIWRHCLPDESHTLDDSAFRQLGRNIDLTGGHIRQITLRAAFAAAALGIPIGLEQVAYATRAELAKLGLPPVIFDSTSRHRAA